MEISPGWVSAGAAVAGVSTTIAGMWIRSAFTARDEKIAGVEKQHAIDTAATKATQATLFAKHDQVAGELSAYKLHVAETYVNREVLREQLAPINESLKDIRHELQEERRK
jgi:hypothetical protein